MYNRREIMTTAWTKYRRFGVPFAQALRLAWYEAKQRVARYTVIGVRIATGAETRTTKAGKNVCTFSVAVNRRGDGVDYFRVSAWGKTGEVCQQHLAKGRKVAVVGPVSVSSYTTQDGQTRADMNVMAQDVEFLTPKELYVYKPAPDTPHEDYTQVDDDDLPF